ncbi:MAG: mannose-1-phosphate guanylyltransferase [Candidatus Berkelbacteria bacterium]|nr:MAG: mannose-1-phosphate guanylyltransferase [Candidatus Berkelbacteria bacterium]QQG51421.1 MAG: mannose-1-phosphate guanylyltransferase [Candidatus Berkelbacteria bacterium]
MAYHAVIMAGGTGTRLWPLSRKDSPKQFQKFIGDKTLIQQTYDRIIQCIPAENIWVMTGEQYVDLVKAQLPEVDVSRIITEPVGRNTAPATGLAMLRIAEIDPQAIVFGLLPADHYVGKIEVFTAAVKSILSFLENHREFVVTIGINPTEPNTGLGYIEMGEQLEKIGDNKIFKVESFQEKPDLETAQKYVEQWEYLWNGGYYLFSVREMIEHYRRLAPEILEKLEKFVENPSDTELYKTIPAEPIDKAIAEKLDSLAVVPVDMDWSDIGNWATLQEILGGNGALKQVILGHHIGINTDRSFVFGNKKLIATVGLEDIVVIETEDAILVAHRDAVQDVKKVVEQLQEQEKHEYL